MSQSDINPTNYCYMAILAPRSSHFSDTFFDKQRKEDSDTFFEERVSLKKFLKCHDFTIRFSLTFLPF